MSVMAATADPTLRLKILRNREVSQAVNGASGGAGKGEVIADGPHDRDAYTRGWGERQRQRCLARARRGLENVKLKLLAAGVGRGASVRGFEHPSEIPRDFVEDRESSRPRSILCETPVRDLRLGQASPRNRAKRSNRYSQLDGRN